MTEEIPIVPASRNEKDLVEEVDNKEVDEALKAPDDSGLQQGQTITGQVSLKVSDVFTILASGFALISDGYHNAISTVFNAIFKIIYPTVYTATVSTRVSNALLVGEIFGMLIIGFICDRVGRKTAVVSTTSLIVLGSILCTAAGGTTPSGLFWMLTVSRGLVGLGVGGEYPACSTQASESANEKFGKYRGRVFVLVTNGVLSLGGPITISLFLFIINAAGYKSINDASDIHILNYTWRILFAIGTAFPLSVFYFRMKMMNPKLYRRNAIRTSVPLGVYVLFFKRYWRTLLGTAGTWFMYDAVLFPNSVFSSVIIASVLPNGALNKTMQWNLLLTSLGLPSIVIGAMVVHITGRRHQLALGFAGYIVFGLIVGISYDKLTKNTPAFIIMYAFMQNSGTFGPGNMEGTISAESYPTSCRGIGYGMSAAFAKVGAVIGTQAFTPIQAHLGKRWTFIVAACCGLLGIVLTYTCVPDKTKDKLEKEDELWRLYLVDHGYGDLIMGDGTAALREAGSNNDVEKLEFD